MKTGKIIASLLGGIMILSSVGASASGLVAVGGKAPKYKIQTYLFTELTIGLRGPSFPAPQSTTCSRVERLSKRYLGEELTPKIAKKFRKAGRKNATKIWYARDAHDPYSPPLTETDFSNLDNQKNTLDRVRGAIYVLIDDSEKISLVACNERDMRKKQKPRYGAIYSGF